VKESIPPETTIFAGTEYVIHISTVMSNIQFNVDYKLQQVSQYSPDLNLPWHISKGCRGSDQGLDEQETWVMAVSSWMKAG